MRKAVAVLSFVFVAGIVCVPSWADEPQKMDILDFMVDGKDLVGKTVIVTGCKFKGADTMSVLCSAGMQGNISIESNTLDKEDFRRALKTCAGLASSETCAGSVTGTVDNKGFGPRLVKAKINWAQ